MAKAKRKATPQEATKAYAFLIASCDVRGYETRLHYASGRWVLDVHEGHELIARGRSGLSSPLCFAAVASTVRRTLENSGKFAE